MVFLNPYLPGVVCVLPSATYVTINRGPVTTKLGPTGSSDLVNL